VLRSPALSVAQDLERPGVGAGPSEAGGGRTLEGVTVVEKGYRGGVYHGTALDGVPHGMVRAAPPFPAQASIPHSWHEGYPWLGENLACGVSSPGAPVSAAREAWPFPAWAASVACPQHLQWGRHELFRFRRSCQCWAARRLCS